MFQANHGPDDAALKVTVQWNRRVGSLALWLSDGTRHDQRTGALAHALPVGAWRLNDLGFFNGTRFAADQTEGSYFFSRYPVGASLYTADGHPLALLRTLRRAGAHPTEWNVQLGEQRLPCRLTARPVPPEQVAKRRKRLREPARHKPPVLSARAVALARWTLYVTHVPPELLAPQEAAILGSTRWQMEWLFKLWKSRGWLDETRSQHPVRVLCEFYAKLLALRLQPWRTVVGCWPRLNRSLHRATPVIRTHAFAVLETLLSWSALIPCLHRLAQVRAQPCGLSKRAAQPLTFQRWLDAAYA